jgi:hypothetical protein
MRQQRASCKVGFNHFILKLPANEPGGVGHCSSTMSLPYPYSKPASCGRCVSASLYNEHTHAGTPAASCMPFPQHRPHVLITCLCAPQPGPLPLRRWPSPLQCHTAAGHSRSTHGHVAHLMGSALLQKLSSSMCTAMQSGLSCSRTSCKWSTGVDEHVLQQVQRKTRMLLH